MSFAKFLRKPFFTELIRWLLLKIDVLKNFVKFTGKHQWRSLFNKVVALQHATLLKETPAQVFFCEFWLIFRNTSYIEYLGWKNTSALDLVRVMWSPDFIALTRGLSTKKLFRKYFGKTHRWTLAPEYLFQKVAGLQPPTLLKRDFDTGVFPLILCYFRAHFYRARLKGKSIWLSNKKLFQKHYIQ